MKVSRLWGICVLALALLPAQARAHLKLESSVPMQGDTVREPVSRLILTFTEAVDEKYLTVRVVDAFGQELALGLIVRPVGSSPSKEYTVELDTPLAGGAFTVQWRTVGQDGHAVTGMFDFMVIASTGGAAAAAAQTSAHPPEHAGHHTESFEIPPLFRAESSLLWIVVRWLHFTALVLLIGAVVFRLGVFERAASSLAAGTLPVIDDAVRRTAMIAAAVVVLANLLRFWLQFGSIHGTDRMLEGELVGALLLRGGWGRAWLAQTLAAIACFVAARVRTEDRSDSWYAAVPFVVIAGAAPAFSGHAAAVEQMAIVPILDDAIHILAASAWLGTLAVLLFAATPHVLRGDDGLRRLSVLVNTFSPLALLMATIAVVTGALNAFIHIAGFSDLWTTPYGRTLAIKIGLVVITVTLGAYNWRVVRPRLGGEAGAANLKRSARTELAFAALILVVTAVLVATPLD